MDDILLSKCTHGQGLPGSADICICRPTPVGRIPQTWRQPECLSSNMQPHAHRLFVPCVLQSNTVCLCRYAQPLHKGPRPLRSPRSGSKPITNPIPASTSQSGQPRRPEWQDSRAVRSLSPPLTRPFPLLDPLEASHVGLSSQQLSTSRRDALGRLRMLRTHVPAMQKENQNQQNAVKPAADSSGVQRAAKRPQRVASQRFALLAAAFCGWHRVSQHRW